MFLHVFGNWIRWIYKYIIQFFNIITHMLHNDAYYPDQLTVQHHNPTPRNSHKVIIYFVWLSASENSTATCSIYCLIYGCTIIVNVASITNLVTHGTDIICYRMNWKYNDNILCVCINRMETKVLVQTTALSALLLNHHALFFL